VDRRRRGKTCRLDESYDHTVRSEMQDWRSVGYITENPTKAGLCDDEYWLYKGGARLSSVCIPAEGQCEVQTGMSAPPSHTLPQASTSHCAEVELIDSRIKQLSVTIHE
jgi:hypothetical protein